MTEFRIEKDSMGEIPVPAERRRRGAGRHQGHRASAV